MSELETKIAEWRAQLAAELRDDPESVRELESHMRDQLDEFADAGVPPGDAFVRATAQIGDLGAVARELRRARSRWFGNVHSWEMRLLAYVSGSLGLLGGYLYTEQLLRRVGQLATAWSAEVPDYLAWTIFRTAISTSLVVVCGLVVHAAGRFLNRPNVRDARSIGLFSLSVVWWVVRTTGGRWGDPFSYLLVLAMTGALAVFWRAWVAQLEPKVVADHEQV